MHIQIITDFGFLAFLSFSKNTRGKLHAGGAQSSSGNMSKNKFTLIDYQRVKVFLKGDTLAKVTYSHAF